MTRFQKIARAVIILFVFALFGAGLLGAIAIQAVEPDVGRLTLEKIRSCWVIPIVGGILGLFVSALALISESIQTKGEENAEH